MRTARFLFLASALLIGGVAISQAGKSQAALPDHILLGRHTFFDFGPPTDFYEVLSLRSDGKNTLVERVTVTPSGDPCTQVPTIEIATASIDASLEELMGKTNVCAIPEKELQRELKRCKHCLVFSGADVVMQAQCGSQNRRIRMDILDRDMFDPSARTPEHTSWTMSLLGGSTEHLVPLSWSGPLFSCRASPSSKLQNQVRT